jgi:6-phosphogluconolactonase
MYFQSKTVMSVAGAVCALSFASLPVMAATYVYVSNAADGKIAVYTMNTETGELQPQERVEAAAVVMPMEASPDKQHLYAAIRSDPYSVYAYKIDQESGALELFDKSPLVESMPYLALDKTGRWLFAASYGGNLVTVTPVEENGEVAEEPHQVIPTGFNAHSINIDGSNRYVYVPTLGTDQVLMFTFDAESGLLSSNTPPALQLERGAGPRHFAISPDNQYVYILGELNGTVYTAALNNETGLLTLKSSESGIPRDADLVPGQPRGAITGPNVTAPADAENAIWAADIQITPDGRFLYMTERATSTIGRMEVDQKSGELTYLGSTETEKQPRGIAITPDGKYLVASGQKSPTISVYAIDPANGDLETVGQYETGEDANWVEIVRLD